MFYIIATMKIEITAPLAEIMGIHAGDGYLRYLGTRKEIDISGSTEERSYYDDYLIPLVNTTFQIDIKGKYFPSRNTYGFVIRDRNVINIFKEIGFPSGNKSKTVKCPKSILTNSDPNIWAAFLRGYFDTDGSITFDKKIYCKDKFKKTRHYYPRIMFSSVSKNLTNDVIILLKKLGFDPKVYMSQPKKATESLKYKLQLVGVNNIEKWVNKIGSKNPSKISRYLIWKKYGFCPPNTNYEQRINILKEKIDINSCYGPIA
jgi:intein/homing endonuclease